MDSKQQLYFFCLSVVLGFLGGPLYEPFWVIRALLKCAKGKNKGIGIALDVLFFIAFSVYCVFGSFWCGFPDFRAYMWIGFALGLIIYSKILHRIVAILGKVCYNSFTKIGKKAKKTKKELLTEVDISL